MLLEGLSGDLSLKMTSCCRGFTAAWLVKEHGSKPLVSLEPDFWRSSGWKLGGKF